MQKIRKYLLTIGISIIILMCGRIISEDKVAFADVSTALSNAEPVIQVVEYEIIDGNIELDSQFAIKITLQNNNAYATAYNVMAEVNTQDMDLHLVNGQVNQVYYESIGPNQTVSFVKNFTVEKTYPYKNAMMTFTFNYSGENGKEYANSTSITPKVTIPCKLKINVLSVSDMASLGARSLVNVRCTNDGIIDISQIVMRIEGNIEETQKDVELGELKAGEQLMQDCYVSFTKSGAQDLKISFVYKDDSGNEYSLPESTYAVNVIAESMTSIDTPSKSGNGISIKMILVISVVVIGIIYVIIKLYKSIEKGEVK